MNANDLKSWISGLTQDITFRYRDIWGSICPFSRSDISLSYGDDEKTFRSVDAVMDTPFIDGKPLKEICGQIEFE